MILLRWAAAIGAAVAGVWAQAPLPALRVEAVDAGSILYVKNRGEQPLTAFLVELVDYPGSSFRYLYDDLAAPIAPGVEKRIAVGNMLPGAVPDSVKVEAAIFADGSTAGTPAKVERLVERRRTVLETMREALRRIGAGERAPELWNWSAALRAARKEDAAAVVAATAERVATGSVEMALEALRKSESLLASSKPALVR